jgi:hypothetical protein
MYYVTYFYLDYGGRCEPLESLFNYQELYISAPISSDKYGGGTFWAAFKNSARIYEKEISHNLFLRRVNWQSFPIKSEDIPWLATFMLFGQCCYFWAIHPYTQKVCDESSQFVGDFLGRPKSSN